MGHEYLNIMTLKMMWYGVGFSFLKVFQQRLKIALHLPYNNKVVVCQIQYEDNVFASGTTCGFLFMKFIQNNEF